MTEYRVELGARQQGLLLEASCCGNLMFLSRNALEEVLVVLFRCWRRHRFGLGFVFFLVWILGRLRLLALLVMQLLAIRIILI